MAQVAQPSWGGYARNAQHTALAGVGTQPLARIRWRTSVDLRAQLWSGSLLIHYGSPLITQANTVIVPMKGGATGAFRVMGLGGSDGGPPEAVNRAGELGQFRPPQPTDGLIGGNLQPLHGPIGRGGAGAGAIASFSNDIQQAAFASGNAALLDI